MHIYGDGGVAYIYSNMTNNRSMIRQPDILGIMTSPICVLVQVRSTRILIDDESARNIDLHRARVYDGIIYLSSVCSGSMWDGRTDIGFILGIARKKSICLRSFRRHCGMTAGVYARRIGV